MNISNAEKQARFRRKEELKKAVEQIFHEWQFMAAQSHVQPREVLTLLNEAIELSAGWTDEDYLQAQRRLQQLRVDLITSQDQVSADVQEAKSSTSDFMRAPDPSRWIEEKDAAVGDAHALAAHLISGLELSRCIDADRAAALMEAVRHVGRSLTTSPQVPRSNATLVCLASLPSHYDRPDWLVEALVQWLAYQFDEELTRELGKRLSEYDYKTFP